MKPDQTAPEALDAYLDAALGHPVALPDDLPPVDPATATVAAALRADAEAITPRPGFVAELEARLLGDATLEGGAAPAGVAPNRVALHQPQAIPPRRRAGPWLGRVAAVALLLLGLGVAFRLAPNPRGQQATPDCLVDGVGFTPCDATGVRAPSAVSASRDDVTLTVTHLVSAGEDTSLGLELSGLSGVPQPGVFENAAVTLRDDHGREYAGLTDHLMMAGAFIEGPLGPDAGPTVRTQLSFRPIQSDARTVEVQVDGPAPVGAWTLRVPLVPLAEGLVRISPLREGGSAVPANGVALRVLGYLSDVERTAVQVAAQADAPLRSVRLAGAPAQAGISLHVDGPPFGDLTLPPPLGPVGPLAPGAGGSPPPLAFGYVVGRPDTADGAPSTALPALPPLGVAPGLAPAPGPFTASPGPPILPLMIRDESGGKLFELAFPPRRWQDRGPSTITSLLFPPLAAGTHAAELVVDQVMAVEQVPEARLVVPVGGQRPGERIPLSAQVALGPYTVRIESARILQGGSERRLALELAAEGTVAGRRFLGPEHVRLDGRDGLSFNQFPPLVTSLLPGPLESTSTGPEGIVSLAGPWLAADHTWVISDPLPGDLGGEATIVLRDAVVAIPGPWHLALPIPSSE